MQPGGRGGPMMRTPGGMAMDGNNAEMAPQPSPYQIRQAQQQQQQQPPQQPWATSVADQRQMLPGEMPPHSAQQQRMYSAMQQQQQHPQMTPVSGAQVSVHSHPMYIYQR